MGVRGLQSFLKNNACFFSNYQLADTEIIVDACNLSCCTFVRLCESPNYKRNDLNGGDFVAYGNLVRLLFDAFKKCNVKPIFVFDGSVIGKQSTGDQKALKFKTVYKRGSDRFESARRATEDDLSVNMFLPLLLSNTFKKIIAEYGYETVVTPYEADAHIARLANERKCPVLSDDSDFVVFQLPVGTIMIDMMHHQNLIDFNPPRGNGTKHYIPCQILSAEKVVRYFPGLSTKTLPLCSILLGNDFIEAQVFERVLIQVAPDYRGPISCNSRAHWQIARVMAWLCYKSIDEAIEALLAVIRSDDKSKIRAEIHRLLRSYQLESSDNFEQELDEVYPPQLAPEGQETPSKYLHRLYLQTSLNSAILDIIFGNPFYNYALIDDHLLPSYTQVSYRPRSVMMTLLRSLVPDKVPDEFTLWDRVEGEYRPIRIRRATALENFGTLENLNCYLLSGLDFKKRRNLILDTFRSSPADFELLLDTLLTLFTRKYALQAATICMLLCYVGRDTRQLPKKQFVHAMLLNLVYHAVKSTDGKFLSLYDDSARKVLLLQLDSCKFPSCISLPWAKEVGPETRHAIYRRIMHFTSQFQTAAFAYEMLNSLLDAPLPTIDLHIHYNSCLVYNITRSLRTNMFKIEDLLQGFDTVLQTFEMITSLINCDL